MKRKPFKKATPKSKPAKIDLAKPNVDVASSMARPVDKPEKWYSSWERLRVVIYCSLCLLFTFWLAGTAWYLKVHPPVHPAQVAAKPGPQCTFVSTYEVKDAAGKVVSHRTQNQQGDCVAKEQKPFEFPLWAKILFFTFVAVICLCGGWEILLIFMW